MSQITSSLGNGVLTPKKEEAAWTPIVTEESMLTAARTNSEGPVDLAVANGCPSFRVGSGDRYVTYYQNGRIGDSMAVTHRGEITKTARECRSDGSEIVVKYGFAGRVLLGPEGQAGTVALPATVQVTDKTNSKIRSEAVKIVVSISKQNPLSYFSMVRDVTIPVKPGANPQDYSVVVAFDRAAPGAS